MDHGLLARMQTVYLDIHIAYSGRPVLAQDAIELGRSTGRQYISKTMC